MTGRSRLEEIYPEAVCEMHPDDAAALGLITGDWVNVSSRRGAITLRVLVTGRSPRGTVFVPFHFAEAAANLLTLDRIDARANLTPRAPRTQRPPRNPGLFASLALLAIFA